MIEIVRRVVLILGLFGAIGSALAPSCALLQVVTVDMAEVQERRPRVVYGEMTLEEFTAKETKDRLIRVRGEDWEAFFAAASATASGQAPDAGWATRLGRGYCDSCLFFRPEEPPLSSITGGLNERNRFTYLSLAREEGAEYLGVTYLVPRDAVHVAPTCLAFPYRRYSLWGLGLALLAYVLLPWRKHPAEAVYYSLVQAVILPDLVGCMLASAFFAVPLWVIPATASRPDLLAFGDGWGFLTIIFWAFTLGALLLPGWSTWYATYELLILDDRLVLSSLRGKEDYRFSEMASVTLAEKRPPQGFVVLGALATLVAWRALAPTLYLASQREQGIEIICQGGRRLRIWDRGLVGLERLFQALERAGVRMTKEAAKLRAQ
jgi:hypothetical protein